MSIVSDEGRVNIPDGLSGRWRRTSPIEDGLGKFLPPDALKVVAEDYQQGLLDRLNDAVKGLCIVPGTQTLFSAE